MSKELGLQIVTTNARERKMSGDWAIQSGIARPSAKQMAQPSGLQLVTKELKALNVREYSVLELVTQDLVVQEAVLHSKDGTGIIVKAEGMSWLLFLKLANAIPSAVTAPWTGPIPGMTALHLAADNLRPEYCRLLLARGADPNAIDSLTKSTPLHTIVEDRSDFFAQSLLRKGMMPLLKSEKDLQRLEKEVLDVLLRGGARMDVTNRIGETALTYAIRLGRVPLLRAMLRAAGAAGAPGWVRPGQSRVVANAEGSLLVLAVRYRHFDIVDVLCKMGVKFTEDPNRALLRDVALRKRLWDIDKLLEARGFAHRDSAWP